MADDRNPFDLPTQRTVIALETLIGHIAITNRYQEYMRNEIFPLGPSLRSDHGLGKNHRSFLLNFNSYQVLLIVWKESRFVTASDLQTLRSAKVFGSTPLNCNSLAVHIATDKAELDRARQHIQKLMKIATAYRLIGRTVLDSHNELSGTQHLHDMFVAIGAWDSVPASPSPFPVISAQV